MKLIERHIQKISWKTSEEVYAQSEARYAAIEKKAGGSPPKRHMYLIGGGEDRGTIIWEREWNSFAEMEANYMRPGDPEEPNNADELNPVLSERIEFYVTMDID